VNKQIYDQLTKAYKLVRDTESYAELHEKDIDAVINSLEDLGTAFMSVRACKTEIDVKVTGDYATLKQAMVIFYSHSYKPTDKPKDIAIAEFSCRWHHRDSSTRAMPQFWFYFTATHCTRKKVGTKMVEQDIYEVVCE